VTGAANVNSRTAGSADHIGGYKNFPAPFSGNLPQWLALKFLFKIVRISFFNAETQRTQRFAEKILCAFCASFIAAI
jgi:hypothetical protein